MDRAPSTVENMEALELRVIDGAQKGASAPLTTGVACVLAVDATTPAIGADIVLREEGAAPAAARIVARPTHALIEVLHGELTLAGQVLAAGAQAAWPRHVPLAIGGARVAFGLACEDHWPIEEGGALPGGETPGVDETPASTPLRRRPEVWLATIGAAVAVMSAAALGMAHGSAAPPPATRVDAPTLVQQLKESEFAGLGATTRADGRVEIKGRLGTLAQRQRLEAWLTSRQATPALDVLVDEAVAREVSEVFRINGVVVQVQPSGPGRLVVEAVERDAAKLARAEEIVRRDVRGIEALTLRNTAQPVVPPAPPVVDDPGKRIASIVPGDPAYIVTVDGARYFVGAMLPTGHRITAVAPQSLTLERDGRESTLNF